MFSKFFNKSNKVEQAVLLPDERFSFMTNDEQLRFQDEVTRYFETNHPELVIEFQLGQISDPATGGIYGLDTVAQIYHNVSDREKRTVVPGHFDNLFRVKREEDEILKDRSNFKKMQKLLALRLYGPDLIPSAYEMMVYQKDIEDIFSVLVFDLPSSTSGVLPEDIEKWGVEKEKLFKIALDNTLANLKVQITNADFVENDLWLIESDSIYSSTFVLKLDKEKKLIGKYGSIVAIPHRHLICVLPINDLSVVQMINQLPGLITHLYQEGPGSTSTNLYWYNSGKFTNLPYKLDEKKKKLDFIPPEEFVDVLNQLAEK